MIIDFILAITLFALAAMFAGWEAGKRLAYRAIIRREIRVRRGYPVIDHIGDQRPSDPWPVDDDGSDTIVCDRR